MERRSGTLDRAGPLFDHSWCSEPIMPQSGPIFAPSSDYPSCHAATVVETAPGSLLAAWFGGTHEGHPDVAIWLSRHDGAGWSAPAKIVEAPGVPLWNPVLFRDAAGVIRLFYKAGPTVPAWSGLYLQSRDAAGAGRPRSCSRPDSPGRRRTSRSPSATATSSAAPRPRRGATGRRGSRSARTAGAPGRGMGRSSRHPMGKVGAIPCGRPVQRRGQALRLPLPIRRPRAGSNPGPRSSTERRAVSAPSWT